MKISITTLSENTVAAPSLLAEWGISVLVETDTFATAEKAEAVIRSARTHEPKKIERLRELISSYMDIPRLYELRGLK